VQKKDYGVDDYDGKYLYLTDLDAKIENNPNDAQDEEIPDVETHQLKRIALPEEDHLAKVAERIKNFNVDGGEKLRVRVQSFNGREQIIDALIDDEVCFRC